MTVQAISTVDSNSVWLDSLRKTQTTSTSSTDPTASASSASVTPLGQFMSKLDSLAASDPDKFKALTSQIAGELTSAAQSTSGPQADFLNQLSQKFTDASQSGDASGLHASRGHHHGGGHHRTQAYDAQNASDGSATTPVDPTQAAQTGTSTATGTNVRALFQHLFQEVAQA
jgi:hypothetical protein